MPARCTPDKSGILDILGIQSILDILGIQSVLDNVQWTYHNVYHVVFETTFPTYLLEK